MQFANHLSAGLRPDLLRQLTELGWLDPLAGCAAPQEREKKNENGRERKGKGGQSIRKRSREKGKGKGADRAMERRQKRNGTRKGGGLSPKVRRT